MGEVNSSFITHEHNDHFIVSRVFTVVTEEVFNNSFWYATPEALFKYTSFMVYGITTEGGSLIPPREY